MSFSEDLYTRLSNFAGLTALVSTRIYPLKLKQQDTMPALRYTKVSSVTPSAMGVDVGLTDYRYQFDVFGTTYASADDVLRQLKAATQRWSDAGIGLQDSFILTESDMAYESEVELYRIRLDVRFVVEETFP